MHDVNPLGHLMYLKELDRQAMPQLQRFRSKGNGTLIGATIAIGRRLRAATFVWGKMGSYGRQEAVMAREKQGA